MFKKIANISRKLVFTQMIAKLALLTSLGLFLPFQALATEDLQISNVDIEIENGSEIVTWSTYIRSSSRVDYGLSSEYGTYVYNNNANDRLHELTLSNLLSEETYHFKVTSSANGQTVSSFDIIVDTSDFNDGEKPEIEDFSVAYVTGNTATIHFTTDEKATSRIYYGTTQDFGKSKRIGSRRTSFEYTVKSLTPNTVYYYKIEAVDEYGNKRSKFGDFKTHVDTEPDDMLLDITRIKPVDDNDQDISYTAATISWRNNKLADGVVKYGTESTRLYKRAYPEQDWKSLDQTLRLTNLKPGTRYYFRVDTRDIFKDRAKSNIYSFVTKAMPDNLQQASSNDGVIFRSLSALRRLFTQASALYKDVASEKVYAVVNNQKHYIANSEVFKRYGYSWRNVQEVSSSFLSNLSEVNLVKDPTTDKIYYLAKKGDARWLKIDIPSPSVFGSYASNSWDKVVAIDTEELTSYNDVSLVKAIDGSTVYLLESGMKRPIASPSVFENNGYNWSDIVELSNTHLDAYHTGTTMR